MSSSDLQHSSGLNEPDDVSHPVPPDTTSRRHWWVLALVVLASLVDQLDATVVNIAAPAVQADIGGGATTIQWLAAGYTLTFAVLLVTGGRLGDIYGRRAMFLTGAVGFTLASVACGLSFSPASLIIARFVQGAFGALLIPQGLGAIKQVFPPRLQGAAFGAFAPVIGLAWVGGPILAAGLISWDLFGSGWRMVFLINLPLGLITVIGGAILFPKEQERRRGRLDLIGVALLTAASFLVLLPLVQGRELGWPAWVWAVLVGGLALFAVFVVYERRTTREPVIEPALLANRAYVGGLLVTVVFLGVVAGMTLVLSLYLQLELGFSAVHAALTLIPLTLGIAVASASVGGLMARLGRRVLHLGLGLVGLGLAVLAATAGLFGDGVTTWYLAPASVVIGVGMGCVFGPLFRIVLAGVDERGTGSASGTLSASQQLGGALGIGVVGTLYFQFDGSLRPVGAAMAFTAGSTILLVALAFGLVFLLPREAASGA